MIIANDVVVASTPAAGVDIYDFIVRLYPLRRSITGEGVRQTLAQIGEEIPIEVHEVPTGTRVFDWTVPEEWSVKDAYIADSRGERVVDIQECNLHVVSYSTAVRKKMKFAELKSHLYSIPEHPDWIPYRTSYYQENWGFCLSDKKLQAMEDALYEVVIDASKKKGSLTYGEYFLEGSTSDEVLIYTHICHPSLCNDNLSGIGVCTWLAKILTQKSLRYSYRFVFAPGTIGSITWLACNEDRLDRIKHGLVVALVGDRGYIHYKKSRRGNAEIDRIVSSVLKHCCDDYGILDFIPYGYDERQFCSPGINLPMGRLTRTPNGCYDEYHSSADDLTFVSADALADSLHTLLTVFQTLEANVCYVNTSPKGEPQLGRRGLFDRVKNYLDVGNREMAMLWMLNLSDGENSLLDISERSGVDTYTLATVALDLCNVGLLRVECD